MSSSIKQSRRRFLLQSSVLGAGFLLAREAAISRGFFKQTVGDVEVGAITYSFRSMPGSIEDLLKYCKQSGITALELMGDAAENYAGNPAGLMKPMVQRPAGSPRPEFTPEMRKASEERGAKAKTWRETVGMEKFVELRKIFDAAGIHIYAYKPNALEERNSDAEIEYAMRAAKALGASSVTVELQNAAQTKRLGDLASKHQVYVGYHAHTQATDTAWDEALAQSPYNSMNLDCGHYIAAGGANTRESLLALIAAKHDRISSMHIKDRQTKEHGGKNLEWGSGDTPIKEILQLVKNNKYPIPLTIELEYDIPAGSDAVEEVKKCLAYAKDALT